VFQHSDPKAAGVVITTDFNGVPTEADTQQCPHCGGHWIVRKGSGRPHVWCGKCSAWTCSNPACLSECYPLEKKQDDLQRHGKLILP
jgi:hypothetical protein